MQQINEKLQLNYPCKWLYKLIATEKKGLMQAVKEIFAETEHVLTPSKTSSSGKYISFNLELTVHSEEARNFFFKALKEHSSIKMVL